MATKEIRQKARRTAQDVLAEQRRQRLALERRRDALASTVMVALAERDALARDAEERAGRALNELTATGLSLKEAASWCAGLADKEAHRLSRLATATATATATAARPATSPVEPTEPTT
jgi:hypothetical protein